jgi:hypothetical protein
MATLSDDSIVSTYFPTVAGTAYVYTRSGEGTASLTRTVKPVVDVDQMKVVPIETKDDTAITANTKYYRIVPTGSDAGVYMFAVGADGHIASDGQPLFEIGDTSGNWAYSGASSTGDEPISLTMVGKTKRGKPMKVLGKLVDTIIVDSDSVLGHLDAPIRSHRTIIFGKGIGLIEMDESTQYPGIKRKRVSVLKLKEIKGPGDAAD